MKKLAIWACVLWLMFSNIRVQGIYEVMRDLGQGWKRLTADLGLAPATHPEPSYRDWPPPEPSKKHLLREPVSLTGFIFVVWVCLLTSAVLRREGPTPVSLRLRRHSIAENGRVLALLGETPTRMSTSSSDYLEDICFIEQRSAGWLLICLLVVACLAPGIYLLTLKGDGGNFKALGVGASVVGTILLVLLLRGRVTLGTADGSVMTVATSRLKAEAVLRSCAEPNPLAFHAVSLSTPLASRNVQLRKSRITGVVASWRFPRIAFVLFMGSFVGAVTVLKHRPAALIVPALLLAIVLVLARKRTAVKMIGGHLCFLGTRETPASLLAATTPEKKG